MLLWEKYCTIDMQADNFERAQIKIDKIIKIRIGYF